MRAAAILPAVLAGAPARAHTGEVAGFGPASAARAGAVAATVEDFSAAYYNPAGLARGGRRELALGASAIASGLRIEGRPVAIENPAGMWLGTVQPIGLGGVLRDRLHFGFALMLLPDRLVRVIARAPDEAFFPYYDNRTQRAIVMPALAVRLHRRVRVGGTANLLATLRGRAVATEGASRAVQADVDEQLTTFARGHLGVQVDASDRIAVGLAWRQEFAVPFETVSRNTISGEPLDLNARAEGLFTPEQWQAGVAYDARPGPLLSADALYLRWSGYPGPYLRVDSRLPLVGPVPVRLPEVAYRDVWSARAGAEQSLPTRAGRVALRAGAAFEPTPVPDQPGVSNQLDGDKWTAALGAGLDLGRARIDAHALAQHVADRTLRKRLGAPGADPAEAIADDRPATPEVEVSNPGWPSVTGGGWVLAGGLTVTVAL